MEIDHIIRHKQEVLVTPRSRHDSYSEREMQIIILNGDQNGHHPLLFNDGLLTEKSLTEIM